MNWEAVGAFSELVGAVAVVATLIYLSVQVSHSRDLLEENRKIALGQVYADRTKQRQEDIRYTISSPDVLRIIAEQQGVEDEALLRRMVYQLAELSIDNLLYQKKLGLLEPLSIAMAERRVRQSWDAWIEHKCAIHPYVQEWHDENTDGST